jgi:hypothetical protein
MFFLFKLAIGAIDVLIKGIGAIFTLVIETVVSAVKSAFRSALSRSLDADPMLDAFIMDHIRWRKALTSQRAADDEMDRLLHELDDNDQNGIPDLYDREVTRPEDDFLHIKYPTPDKLLLENDYCRFMPRRFLDIAQPVVSGGKGLVRSETINNMGQYVMIKWNALNPRGPADAPLYPCNALDLFKLGHVSGGQLTR